MSAIVISHFIFNDVSIRFSFDIDSTELMGGFAGIKYTMKSMSFLFFGDT